MSGYRWTSLLFVSQMLLLTGCQSSESGRFAWNPFRKTADKASTEKGDSPIDLPKFASRKSETPGESGKQAPVAEEQVDRLLADGQSALQEERFEDARAAYNEVLSSSPDNATAHHGLAMAADLTEQWADAEYHYRQALRIRPRDANLLCDIGYSYLLQNRYAEAARYLNHAIEVNPQHESAQMNLALLDLRQGNRQAAENRVISKFGSGPQAMQIMAQLESQTSAVTAAFKTDAATAIPANATLEQVQELARRERLEAERRRASQGMSRETAQPANQRNSQPMMPQVQSQPHNVSDTQVVFSRDGLPVGSGYDANTGLPISIPGARHAVLAARSGGQFPTVQNLSQELSSSPSMESRKSGEDTDSYGPGTPGAQPADPVAPHTQYNFNNSAGIHGMSSTGGVGMSHEMMHAAPADSGTPMMGPSATNSPTGAMPMLPISPANTAFSGTTSSIPVSAPQPSGLNSLPARVVQIHSSGAYQTPQSRSVSYGQPLGFDSQSSTPLNQIPNPPSGGNLTSASADSPPPVYLEGLNAGPGAIFPVSVSDPQAKQPSSSAMSGTGTTGLNMNNISSPGTNSVVNGAMYEQSGSALPSQDWANQQQQQLRAQQLQSQRWLEQQSMGRRPVTPPPKDSASWGAGSYNSNPGAWPASRPQAINPLEAYEKQRQQLDSEYNRTLQQLDRQNSPAMPQF